MGISLLEIRTACPKLASGTSAMTAILEKKIKTATIRVFPFITLFRRLHVCSFCHLIRRFGSHLLPGRYTRCSSPDRTVA